MDTIELSKIADKFDLTIMELMEGDVDLYQDYVLGCFKRLIDENPNMGYEISYWNHKAVYVSTNKMVAQLHPKEINFAQWLGEEGYEYSGDRRWYNKRTPTFLRTLEDLFTFWKNQLGDEEMDDEAFL